MPTRPVLIALDLDGTLEDSRTDMVAAAHRVRAQLGLPLRSDAALRPWVNGGMEQLYRKCFDDLIGDDPARYAHVQAAYDADYLENVAVATRLYDGIGEALPQLLEFGALACVTNKPERISRRLLEELGVATLFATVVGGDTCTEAKPHPMMLAAAVERAKVDPRTVHVLMIGDTAADMQLARAFGATGIWAAWGYTSALPEPPQFIAQTPGELVALVPSIVQTPA